MKDFLNNNNHIFFCFNGIISQSFLVEVSENIENKLKNINNKISRNLFAIFIEQMQNIMNYSNSQISLKNGIFESNGIAIIGFSKNQNKYFVGSSNIIEEKNIENIENKIKTVNSLNKEELKLYYRKIRKSGKFKHEKGAGLGFLEMAKRSNEPLEYRIKRGKNDKMLFELFAYISNQKGS